MCDRTARRFKPVGDPPRPDALCPWCGSRERHRALWLYVQKRTTLLTDGRPRRMLHIAPEPIIERKFRSLPGMNYLSGDLMNPRAMERIDVTDIQHPDAAFNLIVCLHVLEHVPDDRRAMREFFRVLRPGGIAFLMVPITADRTVEDPTVTDPAERLRLYGQDDHVRRYGPDYADRLREAGFALRVSATPDFLPPEEIERCATTTKQIIFECSK